MLLIIFVFEGEEGRGKEGKEKGRERGGGDGFCLGEGEGKKNGRNDDGFLDCAWDEEFVIEEGIEGKRNNMRMVFLAG